MADHLIPIRVDQLASCRTLLEAGSGVLVVGGHGSGRTGFVQSVLGTLTTATRSRLWVGDDVEHLEPAHAQKLTVAIDAGSVVPLLTMQRRSVLHPKLARLVNGTTLTRLPLEPLTSHELLRVTESILGAPLDLRAVSSFVSVRGGSDLALHRDFLLAVQASGCLESVDGVMRLTDVPVDVSASFDLVRDRIGDQIELTPVVRTAVELMALAPGLSVATVGHLLAAVLEGALLAGAGAEHPAERLVEQFEELGLIEVVGPTYEPCVRLTDGVLETVTARGIGRMRRRRYSAAVVDVLEGLPASQLGPTELVALARASLELARPIDPMLMTRAAMLSFRAPDMTLSLAIARNAVERGGGFQAEMALAVAESQNGLSEQAVERLNRLVAGARDDVERSQAVTGLAGLVTERAVDPEWALGLTHMAGVVVHDPSALSRLDTARALMLHALGDADGAAQLVEPALDALEGASLVHALFVLAGATMLRGELTRCFETLDRGAAMLRAAGADPWSVTLIRAVALGFAGRMAEAFAIVHEFLGAALNFGLWEQQGLALWADGGLMLTSGRAGESIVRLREAIALMQQAGTMRSALIASTDLARAEAIAGEPQKARSTLEPALNDDLPLFDVGAKALQGLGWIHAAEGDLTAAAETFIAAADAYAAAGHTLPELASLEEAARAGFVEAAADRVESLAERMEGDYATLCIRHVRALARLRIRRDDPADARELDAVGAEAERMLLHLTAADAYVEAASVHRNASDARAAAASDRRAAEQLAICGLERSPLREAMAATLVVSEREREIARLAVAGLSNREIAAELVLSVRTVETHLQRIYRKTGVRRREELAAALRLG